MSASLFLSISLFLISLCLSLSAGALPLVTATTLCFAPILKWFIIISYCVLSLWGLYKVRCATVCLSVFGSKSTIKIHFP